MATTLFPVNDAADVTIPGTETLQALIEARGAGLSTGVADTVASGTSVPLTRDTTGDVQLRFITPPLAAVTISGTITFNLWMSENNMSANVGARCVVNRRSNDGLTSLGTIITANRGVELPVNTRAAQNWTGAPTSTALNEGERLEIVILGANVGTMASGFTFNGSFGGATGGADGDSFVTFTETITLIPVPSLVHPRSRSRGEPVRGVTLRPRRRRAAA